MPNNKILKVTMEPKNGNPGKIQLDGNCTVKQTYQGIKELGYVPATFGEITTDLTRGSCNIVISLDPHSMEPHPKNGKPSFAGLATGGKKVHLVKSESLSMMTQIAICLPNQAYVAVKV